MQTPRPLAYLQDSGTLTLQSDALLHKDAGGLLVCMYVCMYANAAILVTVLVSVIALDLDAMNCPVSEPTITIRIMQASPTQHPNLTFNPTLT